MHQGTQHFDDAKYVSESHADKEQINLFIGGTDCAFITWYRV